MDEKGPVVNTLQKWMEVFMRRSMRNFVLYSKEKNVSMSQMAALFHIRQRGICGVSEIAEHLGITSAAASQILERMVQQDLIARSEDPHDRRVKRIAITDKGRQLQEESIRARQGWWEDLERSLSPAEREQVLEALNILIDKTAQKLDPLPEGCLDCQVESD